MKSIKENIEIYIIALFVGIILPLFFFKNSFDPVLIPRTYALTFLTLTLLIILGFRRYNSFNYQFDKWQIYTFVIMMIYMLFAIISGFFAINKIEAFAEITKQGTIVLFFFTVVSVLNFDLSNIQRLSTAIFISTSIFIIIGIYQLIFKVDFANITEKDNYLAYYYTNALTVMSSTLANKNLFSSAIFLSLPFSIHTTIFFKKGFKVLSFFVLFLSLLLVGMLVAKAVWVALGATVIFLLIVLLFYVNKQIGFNNLHLGYKIGFISLIIIAAAFTTFVYTSEGTFATIVKEKVAQLTDFENLKEENIKKAERTYSTQQRVMAYYRSFDMIKDKPLLGVGPANWRICMPKYGLYGFGGEIEQGIRNFQRAHSDLLWVFCEVGLFGFLSYVLIFILVIFLGVKSFFSSSSSELKILSLSISSIAFGFFILSSFDFPKERITHNVFLYSMFAIILNLNRSEKKFTTNKNLLYGFFTIAIIFNLYAIRYQSARFKSEIAAVDHYRAFIQKNMNAIIRESRHINHDYYSIIPFSLPVKYYDGLAYSYLKKQNLALKSFSKAYSQSPYQVAVINNYATILSMMNKTAEAKKLYLEAVNISPRFVDANVNLASLLHNERKYDEAYAYLLNIDFQQKNERYKHSLENILKQKLYKLYKKESDSEIRKKIADIINTKSELYSFHKRVLNANGDFEAVYHELKNK